MDELEKRRTEKYAKTVQEILQRVKYRFFDMSVERQNEFLTFIDSLEFLKKPHFKNETEEK